MGFADYFLKTAIARQAASKGAKAVETVVKAEAKVVNGLQTFGDDIVKPFCKSKSDGFVRQAGTQTQQAVRHVGDTFTQVPKGTGLTFQPPKTGGLTFAPRTRTQSPQQPKPAQVTRPVVESLDDVLPPANPLNNGVDDFWNNRMSQQVNDYLDDVYKTIDDTLGFGY